MELQRFDEARTGIARSGLSPEIETKLALFVGAAKTANATLLAPYLWQPDMTPPQQLLRAQYWQELLAAGLIARVTRWVPQPVVYARGAAIVAPIWNDIATQARGAGLNGARGMGYAGLALGHALLSAIRLSPVLPTEMDECLPFVVALRGIERDNARLQQAQLRLLKITATELALTEREEIIEAKVDLIDTVFSDFLIWLCDEPRGR